MTISNSGSDERGKITGGSAGDQTGGEWKIRSWYNSNWNVVLRHPDKNVREMIANMAEAAAKNDNIGYDQAQRHTFWTQLSKVGYKPEKIITKCEADCSAGVAAIVKGAGYRLGDSKMKAVDYTSYTGNLKSRLKNAGFTALTESKYLTSDKYLLRGDILLNERSHTCINLTTGSMASTSTTSSSSSSSTSSYDKTPDNVKEIQTYMNKVYGSGLVVDGVFGAKTKAAIVKQVQKIIGTTADGVFGANSKKAWGSNVVKNGTSGNLTRLVQMMLICRGYSVGSYGADGDGGKDTAAAIKKFQTAKGLSVDGVCGKNTAAKLFA